MANFFTLIFLDSLPLITHAKLPEAIIIKAKKEKLIGLYDAMLNMPIKERLRLAKSSTEIDWLALSKLNLSKF